MVVLTEKVQGDIDERAGIVISNGTHILGCLPAPTVQYPNLERQLDLPKGHLRLGETPIQGAIRECFEETGLKFEEADLEYVRQYTVYGEPFYLFRTFYPQLTSTKGLRCDSEFTKGVARSAENTNFQLVPYSSVGKKFFKDLVPLVLDALRK